MMSQGAGLGAIGQLIQQYIYNYITIVETNTNN